MMVEVMVEQSAALKDGPMVVLKVVRKAFSLDHMTAYSMDARTVSLWDYSMVVESGAKSAEWRAMMMARMLGKSQAARMDRSRVETWAD